jgi:GrpB-like predicted nucleotidyltransferase (UPF0157 family)
VLRAAFREDALRVDHIGSNSVPGLAAKDIIDVQISVARFDDVRTRAALEQAGLTWRADIDRDHCPPGMRLDAAELEKRYAARAGPRAAHVHVRVEGRFNHEYALLFRDYLRAHADAAETYAQVKRVLAARGPNDIDAYYSIKDPVCDVIMTGAREWAAATGWRP